MRASTSYAYALKSEQMPRTLSFNELPAWMKKDPRIQTGYRDELRNTANCLLSLFYIHNEFVNIWSHLLPAFVYAAILAKEARFALLEWDANVSSEMTAIRFYVATSFLLMAFSVRMVMQCNKR